MGAKVKVLVIDEQNLFLEGVCALLKISQDIEIVGQATNGEQAIEIARQQTPDVVLTDMNMLTINGNKVIQQLRSENGNVKVLLLSQHEDRQHILRGMMAGSNGYIPKSATPSELVSAIITLHSDGFYFHPSATKTLMYDHFYDMLTDRQKEVFQLLVDGLKCREVAARLRIADRTVQHHAEAIMKKLHVRNRAELIEYATYQSPDRLRELNEDIVESGKPGKENISNIQRIVS